MRKQLTAKEASHQKNLIIDNESRKKNKREASLATYPAALDVYRHPKDDRYPLQFPRSTLVLPAPHQQSSLQESRRNYLHFRILHFLRYILILFIGKG